MSVNSQPSFNIILTSPHPVSNSTINYLYLTCQNYASSKTLYTMYSVMSVLLFPLYVFVLHMGVQQWRSQLSVPARTTNNVNIFTYHIIFVEIISALGSVVHNLGVYTSGEVMSMSGVFVSCIVFPGQTLFQGLTCVEHYLAVVHPITYLRLREPGGVWIRHISSGCVWLLCFGWVVITKLYYPNFPFIPFYTLVGFSIIVELFCCLSVLFVLTHPGPGEVGENKERVNQSKQRAFHIITTIVGVLLLKSVSLLVCFNLYSFPSLSVEVICTVMDLALWLTLPSSLVLPLLSLHRAGKLPCCRKSAESG